jgi:putative Holliday junction resolvase
MNRNSKMNFEFHQPLTLVGFDYGTKSIGVAVGQTITRTAESLKTVKAIDGMPNWKQIDLIVKEWLPDAFVVGIPFSMDGSEQAITLLARDFSDQLRERFRIPVYEMDERLTSVEARSQLFEKRGFRGLKKDLVDTKSAQIILEDWMSSRRQRTEDRRQ